ncbi:hypothetical protein LCGC14_1158230, partial [marine sediment metagenome]
MNDRLQAPPGPSGSRYPLWVAVAVCVGVGLSILVFLLLRRAEAFRTRAEFEAAAAEQTAELKRHIDGKLIALKSLQACVRSHSGKIDRKEFGRFARALLDQVRGIRALEWAPRVRDADRAAFEAAIAGEGITGFRITERDASGRMVRASRREEYFPISMVAPRADNEAALGVVQISATDASADEEGQDTGAFTVTRDQTSGALVVNYT